jgi:hypothetical protein
LYVVDSSAGLVTLVDEATGSDGSAAGSTIINTSGSKRVQFVDCLSNAKARLEVVKREREVESVGFCWT